MHRLAAVGQVDSDLPFVLFAASAYDKAGAFESLDQRRDGAGFEGEPVGDCGNHLSVLFPEHAENEVLRIGDAEAVEQGLVGTVDRNGRAVKREAKLAIQRNWSRIWHGRGPFDVICPTYHKNNYRDKKYLDKQIEVDYTIIIAIKIIAK